MRALIQRASYGAVSVNGETIGEIGQGMVILLGVTGSDTEADSIWLAAKIAGLRVFEDERGAMNLSLLETGGQALVIPQFTLYGDARRGRRPSFTEAAPPDVAEPLFEHFCAELQQLGLPVARGRFRAHMLVQIHNDGPVTLMVDSAVSRRGSSKPASG
ncbi:MAG: D-aminoacyl-tRNA deacylase [Anaerolineae bacterium]|jgi:D-tyrosyl-tRNA(Tyr) deacylase|nr:D-tyrosyl-tRNA(Tyr) deacylase [Chloroflexota bacterium]